MGLQEANKGKKRAKVGSFDDNIDVECRQGPSKSEGNKSYQCSIKDRANQLQNLSEEKTMDDMVKEVFGLVKQRGGRFLRHITENEWDDLNEKEARDKIKKALRDKMNSIIGFAKAPGAQPNVNQVAGSVTSPGPVCLTPPAKQSHELSRDRLSSTDNKLSTGCDVNTVHIDSAGHGCETPEHCQNTPTSVNGCPDSGCGTPERWNFEYTPNGAKLIIESRKTLEGQSIGCAVQLDPTVQVGLYQVVRKRERNSETPTCPSDIRSLPLTSADQSNLRLIRIGSQRLKISVIFSVRS